MDEMIAKETNLIVRRTPDLIAAEINNIKSQTRKIVLYNSIEIGRRLVEAKALVPHGEWGKWLETSVDYSQSTANNLMRIFQEYGADQISLLGEAKSQAFGNLSYSQAVALLGVPQEEREQFVEENDVENMSTRELQKAIKEKDQALKEKEEVLKKLENANRIANEKSEEAKNLLDEKQKVESEQRTTEKILKETQKNVKKLQDALEEEKEKSKLEINRLQEAISNKKEALAEAQDAGNSEEVEAIQQSLKEKEDELEESKRKIQELEEQIQAKAAEINAKTVEADKPKIKFSIYFEELAKNFKALLSALEEISDQEEHEQYKNAVIKLMDKMKENL